MNWIFTFLKAKRLRNTKSLNFKMWMETETIISSAVEEVKSFASKLTEKIKTLQVELHQKKVRIVETTTLTDPWGNKTSLIQPAFTKDEIERFEGRKRWLGIIIFFFVLSEIALYYMISEKLIGNLSTPGIIALSVVFAIFVLYAFNKSLTYYYIFNEARYKYAEKMITEAQYKKAFLNMIIVSIMLIIATIFLIYAGLGRIYLIEGASSAIDELTVNNNQLAEVIGKGNRAVSVMAMVFTLGMAILLAILKKDMFEAKQKYVAYKAWKKNIERQEKIVGEITGLKTKIKNKVDEEVEITHQLALDLMRIYGIEVDAANEELYEEFLKERSQSGFVITEDVFNKYQKICSVDNRLLSYAINQRIGILNMFKTIEDNSISLKTSVDELHLNIQEPQISEVLQRNPDAEDSIEQQIVEMLNK